MTKPPDREREEEQRWVEVPCPHCGLRHMARVRPAYQFFPDAEESETGLKMAGLAAFGLWRRMLNIMHEAVPRGWLVTASGKRIADEQLARLVNEKPALVKKLLAELEDNGVFSRTDQGVIYSRRMIRDEHISNVRAAAGSKGGNPSLVSAEGSDLVKQNGNLLNQIPTPAPASAPSSAPASASAPSTASTAVPRSESSSSAASSSERGGGVPETVPLPRSARPAAASSTHEKANGNGNSVRSGGPPARAASSKKLSAVALNFLDTYYASGDATADRRKDVRRGLTRLTLGAGDAYRGQLLHATDAQLRDAIQQLEEAWPIDNPDAAMPFILGCLADMQDVTAPGISPEVEKLLRENEAAHANGATAHSSIAEGLDAARNSESDAGRPVSVFSDWRSVARKTQPQLVVDQSPRIPWAEKVERANRIASDHPDWKEQEELRALRLLPSPSSEQDRIRHVVNALIAREENERVSA